MSQKLGVYGLRRQRSREIAGYESARALNSKSQTLFCANREHVLDEIVAILGRDQNFDIHPIPDFCGGAESTYKEFIQIHGLRSDNRTAPELRTGKLDDIGEDVTVFTVLRQFDVSPIRRVKDDAVSRVFCERGLKDREAQNIDLGRIDDGYTRIGIGSCSGTSPCRC